MQAISGGRTGGKKTLRRGIIKPSQLPIEVKTQQDPTTINQVRIVPRNGYYVVEVIYEKAPIQANVDPSFCVGIDLGITNLAAIASNREGFIPRQEANIGRRTNQNFVRIPHARFIDMLTYKAALVGIAVEVTGESYTSKASFLDLDPIPSYNPNDEQE
jgi:transposase